MNNDSSEGDKITIIHQNIQSIGNCVNRLEKFIQDFPDCFFVCLTEHWKTDAQLSNFGINNFYLAEAVCRKIENQHGGSAIFARQGTQLKSLKHITALSEEGICECSVCQFTVNGQEAVIMCVYTPGGVAMDFLRCLEGILSKFVLFPGHIFLVGDFNIPMHEKDNSREKELLFSLLNSYNMFPMVKEYTRVTKVSKSLIDNIFTNYPENCEVKVHHNLISDHAAQSISFFMQKHNEVISTRIFNDFNKLHFKNRLKEEEWTKVYTANNPDETWNNFHNTFLYHFNISFPIRRIKQRKKPQTKLLNDPEIQECKRQLDVLYVVSSVDTTFRPQYNRAKKLYEDTLARKKAEQFQNQIESSDNKAKTVWAIINNIKSGSGTPRDIQINGDGEMVANQLNSYFLNCATSLLSDSPAGNHQAYFEQADRSMFLKPITETEIIRIVNSLSNKHSSGDDEIPTSLIKFCINEISTPLTHAISTSFRTGIFPEKLKLATVIPLHKKGNTSEMENYRPISLLPGFSKVFEKCMSIRIMEYFLVNDMFYMGQHAYMKGRGTQTALYEFTESILQSLENKNHVMGLFLDLTKAYDCVNHQLLTKKLMLYGISGNVLSWLRSYLSARTQQTVVTKQGVSFKSRRETVKMGIPQGSIIGPILFIIYVNDAQKCIEGQNCFLTNYADDKNLLITNPDLQTLLYDADRIFKLLTEWTSNERLILNEKKTNCVIFKTNRSSVEYPNNIYLNESNISISTETKLLGLTIDSVLSWEAHIEKLNKRLNSVCYTLRVMSQYLNENGLKVIYFSNFESLVRYGLIFYGSVRAVEKIFIAQKRAVRIINKLNVRTSCRGFFKRSNFLTVTALHIEESIMFLYKNRDYFSSNLPTHSYNNRNNFYIYPVHRLTVTEKGAKYSCMKYFNKLPLSIRQIENISSFKKRLHRFLLDLEPYTIDEYLNSSHTT